MTAEQGGFNPESVQREQIISNLRQEIKTSGLLDTSVVKSAEEKNEAGKRMVESLGINKLGLKVDSVDGLLEMKSDPNLGDKSKENIDLKLSYLAEAVYCEMAESDDNQVKTDVIAGSYSIEKRLPENMVGLGDAVANHFTNNYEIRAVLETVDVIKNDSDLNQDEFLLEQVRVQRDNLNGVKVDFRNKREMMVKAQGMKYLSDLEKKLLIESESDVEDDDVKAMLKTPRPIVTRGEDGQDIFEGGYGPDMETFTRKVLIGTRTDFRDGMPPAWYKNLTKEGKPGKKDRLGKEKGSMEQWKYRIIAELADFSGSKMALKDGDLETLANKARPAMAKEEFKALYEMDSKTGSGLPGFKESLEVLMKDLFEYQKETGLLKIRESGDYQKKFQNFFDYESDLAEQLYKGEGLFTGKKPDGIKTLDEAKIALGTAWNFIFIGDTVESADERRLLNPGKAYGDKVAAMFHPESKLLRKFKLRQVGGKEIEKKGEFTGEEESYGGSYGEWWFNRMSEDAKLRQDVAAGKVHIFPNRLAMSFVESFGVFAIQEDGSPAEMSMARALSEGKTIVTNPNQVDEKYREGSLHIIDFNSDSAMLIKYRDIYQASYAIFNQLQGKVEIRKGEEMKWAKDFKNNMALIKQNEVPGLKKEDTGKNKQYLSHVDDVEFLKIAIANTIGVKTEWTNGLFLSPFVGDSQTYDIYVSGILNTPGLITSENRKELIKKLKKEFNAESVFSSIRAISEAKKLWQKRNTRRLI